MWRKWNNHHHHPCIPLCLILSLLLMVGSFVSRRRGNRATGWSEEISKEQFIHVIQNYLDEGASPVKALIRVMAEQNISLVDLKTEMRNTLLYNLWLFQERLVVSRMHAMMKWRNFSASIRSSREQTSLPLNWLRCTFRCLCSMMFWTQLNCFTINMDHYGLCSMKLESRTSFPV